MKNRNLESKLLKWDSCKDSLTLDEVKKVQQAAASATKQIATPLLVLTCDTNVPKKKKKKTNSQTTYCYVQYRLVKDRNAVRKLDIAITLKILVGLVLAFQQSIYHLLRRMEMLRGSNSSYCSRNLPLG